MARLTVGTVYLVGAGPGDQGLLTLRGAELLARADVIIHDALLNLALLRHARASAQIIPAGKGTERLLSQEAINRLLVDLAREGKLVVRLKGGDPYIFGRGGEEAEALAASGVPFEVVPGVSSFSAVPAAAGIPLTHREYSSAVTVLTGHEDPAKPDTAVDWRDIARIHGTKVILMGVERLEAIAQRLMEGGLAPATPVALIQWGTTARQQTVTGTLAEIARRVEEAGLRSPAIVVIGEVVRLREKLNWFEKRPLFGQEVVVTRGREQSGDLSRRLIELGADVLEIPIIRMGPPRPREPMIEALAGLGEYDWVVFSSPNGVTAFFDALLAAFEDIRALGNVRIAAVGPATAARLRQLHLRVDAMPAEYLGRNVAEAIAQRESIENLKVLLARAQVANPELCRELEDRGAIVDDVPFYMTEPELEDPLGYGIALTTSGADWITFTSGSTVENFHARFDLRKLMERHPRIRLASIGPETTKAINALGLRETVQASPHTVEALVAALLQVERNRP
jgi:uroporphyrinogen III methyltransferase/synthase